MTRGRPPGTAGGASPEPSLEERLRAARKVLKVKKNASIEAITAAYRKLAKERHPDRGGTDDGFKELQQAYELLKKHHAA